MAYSVVRTDVFEEQYESILLYLVDVLETPAAALSIMETVDLMIVRLEVTPEICAVSMKPSLEHLELREYLVKNYVVLYRIVGDRVFLEHMFHTKQNFEDYV